MARKSALLLLAAAVAGCNHTPQDLPDRGLAAVNVPVMARADYAFDVSAADGYLAPQEVARLDAWFQGLNLGYGDSIYVDGPAAELARDNVAQLAGNYGMTVEPGAPITAGPIGPGSVRVIVSRTRATVPGCPDWSRPSQPNFNNRMMSNFGCAVNSNLAAMVANPEDLFHGREDSGIADPATSAKAVRIYRTTPPTATKGLQDVTPKKGE